MDSNIVRVVLDEVARRMSDVLPASGAVIDVGVGEIARALHISTDEVENALENLADRQLVTRHMLGRYALNPQARN